MLWIALCCYHWSRATTGAYLCPLPFRPCVSNSPSGNYLSMLWYMRMIASLMVQAFYTSLLWTESWLLVRYHANGWINPYWNVRCVLWTWKTNSYMGSVRKDHWPFLNEGSNVCNFPPSSWFGSLKNDLLLGSQWWLLSLKAWRFYCQNS